MKNAIRHLNILIVILVAFISSYATASEWTEGSPIGPSIRSLGQCANVFGGAAYLFVATSDGIMWQKAVNVSWHSQNWNRLSIQTDAAPTSVEFGGNLYLFVRNSGNYGKISYATYNGTDWSQWKHTSWQTFSAPAVAADDTKLHLFWRDASNKLVTSTFSGGNWSQNSTIANLLTNVAPAAQFFDGNVYLFAVATDGEIRYKRLTDTNWSTITGLKTTEISPVALAVSNGKLFIFAQSSGIGYYRILDRTHQRDDFLPVDEWVTVESGKARTSLAAVGFLNTVYLFYGRNHSHAFLGGLTSTTAPYVFAQSATWSEASIAIVPLAKSDCSQAASTSDFHDLVRFADSVYNPLMIHMSLNKIYPTICDDLIWDIGNQFNSPNDPASGSNHSFWDKLASTSEKVEYANQIVIFITNKSGGGGFSGFGPNYVYHPDHVIGVCNSGGLSSFSDYRNSFPHEIGHYAGLPHTFGDVVKENNGQRVAQTLGEVQSALEAANYDTSTLDQDKIGPWINDFAINDTPPDPFYEKNGVSDMKCTAANTPVMLLDKRTAPPTPIILIPPRTNVMSYYQVSSTIINKLTRDQGRVIYQGFRRKGIIDFRNYILGKENPSKCLHKKDYGWTNGNPIHVWDCNAGTDENKTWIYEASTGYIRGKLNPSKCLHKKDYGWTNGNPIHIWECDAGTVENKTWIIDGKTKPKKE